MLWYLAKTLLLPYTIVFLQIPKYHLEAANLLMPLPVYSLGFLLPTGKSPSSQLIGSWGIAACSGGTTSPLGGGLAT